MGNYPTPGNQLYCPDNPSATSVYTSIPTPTGYGGAAVVFDKVVYYFGGFSGQTLNTVIIFDPSTNQTRAGVGLFFHKLKPLNYLRHQ
jgi:hypothetical protein